MAAKPPLAAKLYISFGTGGNAATGGKVAGKAATGGTALAAKLPLTAQPLRHRLAWRHDGKAWRHGGKAWRHGGMASNACKAWRRAGMAAW